MSGVGPCRGWDVLQEVLPDVVVEEHAQKVVLLGPFQELLVEDLGPVEDGPTPPSLLSSPGSHLPPDTRGRGLNPGFADLVHPRRVAERPSPVEELVLALRLDVVAEGLLGEGVSRRQHQHKDVPCSPSPQTSSHPR